MHSTKTDHKCSSFCHAWSSVLERPYIHMLLYVLSTLFVNEFQRLCNKSKILNCQVKDYNSILTRIKRFKFCVQINKFNVECLLVFKQYCWRQDPIFCPSDLKKLIMRFAPSEAISSVGRTFFPRNNQLVWLYLLRH